LVTLSYEVFFDMEFIANGNQILRVKVKRVTKESKEKARTAALDLVCKIAVIPDEGWFESTTREIRREAKAIKHNYESA
jgi:hypothetical protein